MSSIGQHVNIGDADDYTYTEDPAGQRVKVPVSKEYVFKVVILGDYSVGKTSLIKRLLSIPASCASPRRHEDCSDMDDSVGDSDADDLLATVTPTVGTDFYSLTLPDVVPGASVRLQIWDTAGLEKYAASYESTLRNASFVICVFDVTNPSSLHSVVDRHLSIVADHMPHLDQSDIMVVANKIDIIADVSTNSEALRSARKRARLPENAFVIAIDEDASVDTNDSSPDVFTSAEGASDNAIVTARKVQEEVFDIFTDVHYAEVSAKTKQHLREMLHAVCYALLRNSVGDNPNIRVPDGAPPSEVFAHTVLPPHSGAKCSTGASAGTFSVPQLDPATKTPPAAVPRDSPTTGSLQPPPRTTPAPPAASWRSNEATSFDLAPTHFSSKAVFSPAEGSEGAIGKSGGDDSAPRHVGSAGDSPVDGSSTRLPTPRGDLAKAVDAGGVHLDLTAGSTEPRTGPDPKEDPKARKEREQAEMKAVLSRAGGRKGNPNGGGADTDSLAAWLQSDADRMENDVALGLKKAGDAPSAARPAPVSSILGSHGVQDHCKGNQGTRGRDSDDDDDGARMQVQLKERFAQIEHDIRQNAAAANQRAKKAKKKTKAKGKCNCCQQPETAYSHYDQPTLNMFHQAAPPLQQPQTTYAYLPAPQPPLPTTTVVVSEGPYGYEQGLFPPSPPPRPGLLDVLLDLTHHHHHGNPPGPPGGFGGPGVFGGPPDGLGSFGGAPGRPGCQQHGAYEHGQLPPPPTPAVFGNGEWHPGYYPLSPPSRSVALEPYGILPQPYGSPSAYGGSYGPPPPPPQPQVIYIQQPAPPPPPPQTIIVQGGGCQGKEY
ncbi:Ras family protein [Leishmania donovani]|uniref:Ras family protein n=1 Tax=Leishmania donovani TaxID=5661 RepID=A0A504XCX0_LEIDO|nr:Ras family protein [Leishmania donovani]